jgi:arabinose-5-phosphate isomerase
MSEIERIDIIELAKNTILEEAKAITALADYVDEDFKKVVELVFNSKGRLIITGIGKSANIANKIVATLNSTGTPAIFMHAADAIHGDLGNVQEYDIILCISKSGNTPEIKVLLPLIKNMGNKIVAMISNTESYLAEHSDFVLKAKVEKEACPNNLAPTNSTTAQLVIGDALAVCLIQLRHFSSRDFAKYHPGGSLGKRLYTRVEDVYKGVNPPMVSPDTNIRDLIIVITEGRMGCTAVVDADKNLLGMVTDGDLRRMMQRDGDVGILYAKDIMGEDPKTISKGELAFTAFQLMEENSITQLAVVDTDNIYIGMIHLHDILKEGVV